jgi:Uma2 family endonuclease
MPIYRLSVAQYHAMIQTGILTDDDPVELIRGWLVLKMPKHPPHRVCTRKVRRNLERVLPPGWYAEAQEPVTLTDSEPEPDVSVAREELSEDVTRNPEAADVSLVVEVSDSTLARDRGSKKQLYAEARIPVYWIVNLEDGQIEVYTDPSGPAPQPDYGNQRTFGPTDEVPVVIAGQEVARIPVRHLLP